MRPLTITQSGTTFRIEEYPTAVAVKRIKHGPVHQLRAIALHEVDLEIAAEATRACADLNHQSNDSRLSEALWTAALARFFKCFGQSASRQQLEAKKVLRGEGHEAQRSFDYFQALRDKHAIHDENAYSQARVGILLNPRDEAKKIADVYSISMTSVTCDEAHLGSFLKLVEHTLAWVRDKKVELHGMLAEQYEKLAYDELLALEDEGFRAPTADDAFIKR